MEKAYVFAVCGPREHVETLAVAIRHLRAFSRLPVLVVTDPGRNEIPIRHDAVIPVAPPERLSHAQAAIWLKTSLHRILPKGPRYCYLDADVLAVRKGVDKVFSAAAEPVAFAPDHCPIEEFGPYAFDCGCLAAMRERTRPLLNMLQELDRSLGVVTPELVEKKRELDRLVAWYMTVAGRLALLPGIFGELARAAWWRWFLRLYVKGEFVRDHDRRTWSDASGRLLSDENLHLALAREVKEKLGFWFDQDTGAWRDSTGQNIFQCRCGHFMEAAQKTFGVTITDPKWVQENGGVFVFDQRGARFLETWHRHTMQAFDEPGWTVRDQGTLAVTTWDFHREHAPRLPVEFNFIADYHKNELRYRGGLVFDLPGRKRIRPRFIHVYHEFGRKEWKVWQDIEQSIRRAA
ncbi:MAG: hypothetical protein JRI97_00325 [Deltaproteobacteria bacterium]|nr:hypothetical protein [Deltaproteobacteria bacterium]